MLPPRPISITTEPHPTYLPNSLASSGRGGFGNAFRMPPQTTPSTGIPVPTSSLRPCPHSHHILAGRGGAGNLVPPSPQAIWRHSALEDERTPEMKVPARGHIGRGGAGNVVGYLDVEDRKRESESGSEKGSLKSWEEEGLEDGDGSGRRERERRVGMRARIWKMLRIEG